MAAPFIVEAGTKSRHFGHRLTRHHGGNRRACRGIPDAHIPRHQHAGSGRNGGLRSANACFDGGNRLCVLHGGLAAQIPGATAHLGCPELGMLRQVGPYAHVQHEHRGSHEARQHVDGSTAVQKVEHHLCGHFGGVGTHPFHGHAVVGRTHDDLPRRQGRPQLTGYAS